MPSEKNQNIIGIPLPYINPDSGKRAEAKLVSYVDDTQFFNNSEESISETFKMTEQFEKASGAKLHKQKIVSRIISRGMEGQNPGLHRHIMDKNKC